MVLPFFAALFSAVSSAAATLSATTIAGISLASIGKLALGIGISAWTAAKQSNATVRGQSVLNQATGERQVGYGLCLLGGTRAYFDVHDRALWQVIVFHHGRVNKIRRMLIEGQKVDLDSDGNVTTAPWQRGSDRHYVKAWFKRGTKNQSAYAELIEASGGAWTKNHRLSGLATALVKFDHARQDRYAGLYAKGAQTQIQIIAETTPLYDPRTETTEYSANAALAIRHHLVSPDGFANITERDIDDESIAALADLCDTKRNTPDGQEPLYEAHGLYTLAEASKDVLDRLTATCDVRPYITPQGKIGFRGGRWIEPTFTIDDSMILNFSLQEGGSGLSDFNHLHTYYTDPKQGFQRVETSIWTNADDIARNGKRPSELYLDMVGSPHQAAYLAQIYAAKNNPRWSGTITTTMETIEALSHATVRLKHSEFEIDSTFLLQKFSIRSDLSGIDMTISSIDRTSYNPVNFKKTTPDIPDYTPDLSIPVPQFTAVSFDSKDRILVEVTDPGFEDLDLEVQVQEDGSWEQITVTDYTARSVAIDTGDTYPIRARFIAGTGPGEWQTTTLT